MQRHGLATRQRNISIGKHLWLSHHAPKHWCLAKQTFIATSLRIGSHTCLPQRTIAWRIGLVVVVVCMLMAMVMSMVIVMMATCRSHGMRGRVMKVCSLHHQLWHKGYQ